MTEEPIRVLSVRQPWAWLICSGHKGIENRTWSTSYRGALLIHAGKQWHSIPSADIEKKHGIKIPRDLPMGGIVGIAGLCDVVTRSTDPYFFGPTVIMNGKTKQNYGFVMRGASELPLLPCDGHLMTYEASASLLRRMTEHRAWQNELLTARVAVAAYRSKQQQELFTC